MGHLLKNIYWGDLEEFRLYSLEECLKIIKDCGYFTSPIMNVFGGTEFHPNYGSGIPDQPLLDMFRIDNKEFVACFGDLSKINYPLDVYQEAAEWALGHRLNWNCEKLRVIVS